MHKDYLTRTRKDPQDNKKFHLICDVCNKCYLDKQLLTPYMKNVKKLKGLLTQRESDITGLDLVLDEVSKQVSRTQTKNYDEMTQEEQKEWNLTQEINKLRTDIKYLDKAVDSLRDEEERVNRVVLKDEQLHSDKVKLLNEV